MNDPHTQLVNALREVLTDGKETDKAILIQRIPFICNDIRSIKDTLWWISRISSVIGAVILALLTAVISNGNLHL